MITLRTIDGHETTIDSYPDEDFHRQLYAYLVEERFLLPHAARKRARWVMNVEWLNECRKMANGLDPYHPAYHVRWDRNMTETLLGMPLDVDEAAGFPRLVVVPVICGHCREGDHSRCVTPECECQNPDG